MTDSPRCRRRLGRLCALLVGLLALVLPVHSTWSIVVVDVETGEVGIASATCLVNFDLRRNLAVVVPGLGAAAAQSIVDQTGANRLLIWNGIHDGHDPIDILAALAASDPQHNGRQYGIATELEQKLIRTQQRGFQKYTSRLRRPDAGENAPEWTQVQRTSSLASASSAKP